MIDDHKIIHHQEECPCCGGYVVAICKQTRGYNGDVNLGGFAFDGGVKYMTRTSSYEGGDQVFSGSSEFESSYENGSGVFDIVENDITVTPSNTPSGAFLGNAWTGAIDQQQAADDGIFSVFDNAEANCANDGDPVDSCRVCSIPGFGGGFRWDSTTGPSSQLATVFVEDAGFIVSRTVGLPPLDVAEPELNPPPFVRIVWDVAKFTWGAANGNQDNRPSYTGTLDTGEFLDEDLEWTWDGIPFFDPASPTPQFDDLRCSPIYSPVPYLQAISTPLPEGQWVTVQMINVRVYLTADKWFPYGLFWDGATFENFESCCGPL